MSPNTRPITTNVLNFDRDNPRLVEIEGLHDATDERIMCALVDQADIGELIESIVENTYLDIEPLIVIQDNRDRGRYRVLEGNRRLAAIRFLQSPEIARKCKLSIPEQIRDEVYESIKNVTIFEVEKEEDSQAFIAFKHINGAHRWDAYAKARYITDWYIKDYDNGITIEDIARKVGDQNQYVRSIISAMLVLKQAERNEIFDISDRKKTGPFGFSHFYIALGRVEYRRFLGLEKEWNRHPVIDPVDEEHISELQEILRYLYGSKKDNIDSVIKSQNPDVKNLGTVIDNQVAVDILRATNELNSALDEARPPGDIFQDALLIAYNKVQDAQKKVNKYSPDKSGSLLSFAGDLSEISSNILLLMKTKH